MVDGAEEDAEMLVVNPPPSHQILIQIQYNN